MPPIVHTIQNSISAGGSTIDYSVLSVGVNPDTTDYLERFRCTSGQSGSTQFATIVSREFECGCAGCMHRAVIWGGANFLFKIF